MVSAYSSMSMPILIPKSMNLAPGIGRCHKTRGNVSIQVSLTSLIPHPRNYVEHPQAQIDDLKASLLRFGQIKPIACQRCPGTETYMILAGHGLLQAMQSIQEDTRIPNPVKSRFTSIKIELVPDDWSPTDAIGYMLADNETSRKALPIEAQLASLLEEQLHNGIDL